MVLKSRGLGVDGILYTTGIWYRKRPQVETMPEQLSDVGKEEGNISILKFWWMRKELGKADSEERWTGPGP